MANTSTRIFSKKQEKLIASELGGYPVGLSGAGSANPGDVRTYDWLVECKTHTTPDHPILFDIDVWSKIRKEAMAMHRKPALIVDDGSQSISRTWCMCCSFNLNLSRVLTFGLPVKIRKNISCKHEKLSNDLKDKSKDLIFENGFYTYAAYEVLYDGVDVVVMPFKMFKELFDQ